MAPNEITRPAEILEADAPSWAVAAPAEQTVPLVLASPHSGRRYPEDLLAASPLDPLALRRSEDAFVDVLYAGAPAVGAPLLKSHFPRVFLDCNREPYELDPGMFAGPLPAYVNSRSPRVAAGLGTIARVIATGEEVYGRPLAVEAALSRIRSHYFPYHQALKGLIDETRARFGVCLLVDCHSMPSVGGPMDADPGSRRVDIVLGNCFDSACSPAITAFAERVLRDLGYAVRRNVPYAGGFTTRHYGRPSEGVHALQIEINRALYMDERRIAPLPGFAEVAERIGLLISALAGMNRGLFSER
ncbi:MAG TPA: N-formylglutamate amidohydrolase [Rhodospirillales bacterium]|nr:N-formylglutamate amidohydrolase [Rhodospirillales bacterium]